MKRFEDLEPGDIVFSRARWDSREVVESVRITFLRWREKGVVGVFEFPIPPREELFEGLSRKEEPKRLAFCQERVFLEIGDALEHTLKILKTACEFHVKKVGELQGKIHRVEEALEKLKAREAEGERR